MKIFRFFGMALAAICMCVNFAACIKDEGSDGAGGGASAGEKRLVKYTRGDYITTFIYDDNGRVVETRWFIDGEHISSDFYIWKDDTIEVHYNNGKYHFCTYNLLNGLVRSQCFPHEPSEYHYYTYNEDGRLINDNQYVWEGDKLVFQDQNELSVTYTYKGETCKKGYNPLLIMTGLFMTNPDVFGFRTTQLPASSTDTYDQSTQTITYEYEFDAEGYISKVNMSNSKGWSENYTLIWE